MNSNHIDKSFEQNCQTDYIASQTNSDADKYQGILEFLISCSLKDCSIMLTVRRLRRHVTVAHGADVAHAASSAMPPATLHVRPFVNYEDLVFEYELHVVDVDLKPIGKIPFYFERDRTLFQDVTTTFQRGNP
jgi:hypothetical protein